MIDLTPRFDTVVPVHTQLATRDVPRRRYLQGMDVDMLSIGIKETVGFQLLDGGTIGEAVGRIVTQFMHDVVDRCSRAKDGSPYCTLTAHERRMMRVEYFQDFKLPFRIVHIRRTPREMWEKIYDVNFPPKGVSQDHRAAQWKHCVYFHAWLELMNRLSEQEACSIRVAVWSWFSTLWWMPYSTKAGMWASGSKPNGGEWRTCFSTLYTNMAGPYVAINQLIWQRTDGFKHTEDKPFSEGEPKWE